MSVFSKEVFLALLLTFSIHGVSMSEQTSEPTEQVQSSQERSPEDLGVVNGELAPCPNSPNCVSTQAPQDDLAHHIAPVPFEDMPSNVMNRIVQEVTRLPRTRIVKRDGNYLRAEFRSRIFGFVDDVEFYLDTGNNLIHFRSAARRGYGDFGVNRERMEELSELLSP